MRPTFEQTVDVLVKAYLNNTLMHGNCYACAVGNIVANGLGCEVALRPGAGLSWTNGMDYPAMNGHKIQGWGSAFVTDWNGDLTKRTQEINKEALKHYAVQNQIKATGYTWEELAKIEYAFEITPNKNGDCEEWNFEGLMAVVDVLAEIHGVDLTVKESAKLLFIK